MSAISTFPKDSLEYDRLQTLVSKLNHHFSTTCYSVQDTYYDYHAKIKWTTIIKKLHDNSSVQILSPKQQSALVIYNKIDNVYNELITQTKY